MPTILVTGANRGIGLAFVRHALAEGWQAIATCRDPDHASDLRGLGEGVRVLRLDVADPGSIASAATTIGSDAIDVLVNNAGTMGPGSGRLGGLDFGQWELTLEVNLLGPVRVTEAFLPNIASSRRKLVVSISSQMASIAQAGGGYYAYRTSKAALNMAMRVMAADLAERGIICLALSPGWVRTDMGGRSAPLTPEHSVAQMWRTMMRATRAESGKFLDRDGRALSW